MWTRSDDVPREIRSGDMGGGGLEVKEEVWTEKKGSQRLPHLLEEKQFIATKNNICQLS